MTEHIKIPNVAPIVRYVADGAQTTYDFPFPIFASEDLKVTLDGAQQNSGFDIQGSGQTAGGTVLFDTPPPQNTVITLARELPIERVTDYLEGGDFSASSIKPNLITSSHRCNKSNARTILHCVMPIMKHREKPHSPSAASAAIKP